MTAAAEANARRLAKLIADNPRQNNRWLAKQLGMTLTQLRSARLDAERLGVAIVHEQKGKHHRSIHGDDAAPDVVEKELRRSEKSLITSTKTHNMKCDSRNRKDMRRVSMTEKELADKMAAALTTAVGQVLAA